MIRSSGIPLLLFISVYLAGCQTTGQQVDIPQRSNAVAEANYNLGVAYLEQKEYESALKKLNKSLAADSNYAPTHNAMGLLHQQIGNMEKAEEYYKRAVSIAPNNGVILNTYGSFLCQQGRYEDAEVVFLQAATNGLYEEPEIAYTNAGTCALENDRTEIAETYFRNALEQNPKVPVALLQMATLSYDQGKYLPARAYIQRYSAVARHTPRSLWLGIRIERELGDKNALSSYALTLRNRFPDSEEARLLNESGLK